MKSKINEIRSVIAEGNLDKAFFLLKEQFKGTRFYNDIIGLASRYNTLEEKRMKDIISPNDENLTRNKIIESALVLLSKIELDYDRKSEHITEKERNQAINEILKQIEQTMEASKEGQVNILIVGKSGVGKSSIINSLLGRDAAKVGHFKPTTFEVNLYESKINKVQLRIYDTPGLCDKLEEKGNDLEYIKRIKDKILGEQIDCVLFAAELHGSRLELGDQKAIKIISNSFGGEIWKHAVLIFTKADETDSGNFFDYLINRKLIIQDEIRQWSSNEIAQNIPAVATSIKEEILPNGKYWMSDLFTTIFTKISEEGYAPFLHTILESNNEKLKIQDSDKEKIGKRLIKEAKKESSFGEKTGNFLWKVLGSIFTDGGSGFDHHKGGGGWR